MESNKVLKISIVIVMVVAVTYGILSMFLSESSNLNTKFGGFGKVMAPSSSKKSPKSTDELEVSIDKVLVGMSKGPYKYMKADMSFKMSDEKSKDGLQDNMAQARNVILRFSSSQDSSQLATDSGKQKYKEDLKEVLSDNLGYQVDDVYFRNFVLAE